MNDFLHPGPEHRPSLSVTSLEHCLLETLEESPFGELHAISYNGKSEYYSLDVFRRLYNDAVESMRSYQRLASEYSQEADRYRQECGRLEGCLHEVCGD